MNAQDKEALKLSSFVKIHIMRNHVSSEFLCGHKGFVQRYFTSQSSSYMCKYFLGF